MERTPYHGETATQMHHARSGRRHAGDEARGRARGARRRSSSATRWPAAAWSSPPTSTTPSLEPMAHRHQRALQDQREHRQLARCTGDVEEELEKLHIAVQYGADTVMDLSTGGDIDEIRAAIIAASPVPIGTVPIYQAVQQREARRGPHAPTTSSTCIEHQAKQGVDYMTIHAGVLCEHLPLVAAPHHRHRRRAAARCIAQWMVAPHASRTRSTPTSTRSCEICAQVRRHLLARRRPAARLPGRRHRRRPVRRAQDARRADAQGLGEGRAGDGRGPGPRALRPDRDERGEGRSRMCNEAPFYVLGPLVTDIAPGYDHITSRHRRHHGRLRRRRHALLRDAQGAPRPAQRRRRASRASSPTRSPPTPPTSPATARAPATATTRSRRARFAFDWNEQFALVARSRDRPRDARRDAARRRSSRRAEFCSMCGPKFCSMNVSAHAMAQAGAAGGGHDSVAPAPVGRDSGCGHPVQDVLRATGR